MTQTIDVSGLSTEAIAAVEQLVAVLKKQAAQEERLPVPFVSREEWRAAIRTWAESHPPITHEVDWSRERIYEGRGE